MFPVEEESKIYISPVYLRVFKSSQLATTSKIAYHDGRGVEMPRTHEPRATAVDHFIPHCSVLQAASRALTASMIDIKPTRGLTTL